jgi:hypothetical protein
MEGEEINKITQDVKALLKRAIEIHVDAILENSILKQKMRETEEKLYLENLSKDEKKELNFRKEDIAEMLFESETKLYGVEFHMYFLDRLIRNYYYKNSPRK